MYVTFSVKNLCNLPSGATMGVMAFNAGVTELGRVQREFGILQKENASEHAKRKNEKRMKVQRLSSTARKARSHRWLTAAEIETQKKNVGYKPGGF